MSEKSQLDHNALVANRNIKIRKYWKQRLEGLEFSSYFDFATNSEPASALRKEVWTLAASQATATALDNIATSAKAKHLVLLAALGVFIKKYTTVSDIVIFTPLYTDMAKMATNSDNVLPFRLTDFSQLSFQEFLLNLKKKMLQDIKHSNYSLDKMLNLERQHLRYLPTIGMSFESSRQQMGLQQINTAYVFHLENEDQLQIHITYDANKCDALLIEGMAKKYFYLLNELIRNPQAKIADIQLLTEQEQEKLLHTYNTTEVLSSPQETVLSLFSDQVQKTPDAIALDCDGKIMSYQALEDLSNQMAHFLITQYNISPNDLIGFELDRSDWMLVAILGILKCGAAYVPIDPKYPSRRKKHIVEDAGISLLLTEMHYLFEIDYYQGKMATVDIEFEPDQYPVTKPEVELKPDAVCYIIYTSGSTGKPKGVMIEHRSLVNYIRSSALNYTDGEPLPFAFYSSISFDLTVTTIFTPLVTGGSIIIYKEENEEFLIEKVIRDNKSSLIKLTPSHLKMIRNCNTIDLATCPKLKKIIVGGELFEMNLAQAIYDKFDGAVDIFNEYGPTEATVGCMLYKFKAGENYSSVPIGLPINNTQVHLLDENQNLVPIGGLGEIYISGLGLAKGFIGKKELTKQLFIANPFDSLKKIYKTGDMGQRLPNGQIVFRKRIDKQLKFRAYRIEPGEIESNLMSLTTIKEALVVLRERENEEYLTAYYLSEKVQEASILKNHLSQHLPAYMIPAYFVHLKQMPLTANGKLNEEELPLPVISSGNDYIAPTAELEKKIARIWAGILKVDEKIIGVQSNFFELGGSSLKAVELNAVLNDVMNVNLSVAELFRYKTISSQAAFITHGDEEAEEYKDKAKEEVSGMRSGLDILSKMNQK